MRRTRTITTAAALVAATSLCLAASAAGEEIVITEPVVRGEVARLLRQAYDYEHRNSNRNVFRKSRHFHPTRNVFRSSRHYQQKLAASSDGYPLRTFIRFGRSVDGGERELIEYSYATHRRSPFGLPSIEEPGLEALALSHDGGTAVGHHPASRYRRPGVREHSIDARSEEPRDVEYHLIMPVSAEASMRNDDDATARDVVIRRIEREDGSVHTVITNRADDDLESDEDSKLDDASIDDAWSLLNAGDTARAAELFRRRVMDVERGAEAMVGYGLARLLSGDADDAATALRRAQRLDETVLIRVLIDDELAARLGAMLQRGFDRSDHDAADVRTVTAALEELLE